MHRPYAFIALALISCSTPEGSLCDRFFEPYPDIITGRLRTEASAELLDAMALYSKGDHADAVTGLQAHIDHHPQQADIGYLYLASSYLALGRPYDAELQLDFLERWPGHTFRDELDWYNTLSLLCGGQRDRALEQARAIADDRAHAYKQQARELASALQP